MKIVLAGLILGALSWSAVADSAQSRRVDAGSGAITWETQAAGVHFSLTQILPDQVRAFYANRGLSLEQIEPYATSCVYMTVLRNDSAPAAIHFVRDEWSVRVDGKTHPLVPVEQWVQRLKAGGAGNASLVAFRWAQFPPEQSYEPGGDWNQGMLSFGLPAGTRFDVLARWDSVGQSYEAKLKEVQCAD